MKRKLRKRLAIACAFLAVLLIGAYYYNPTPVVKSVSHLLSLKDNINEDYDTQIVKNAENTFHQGREIFRFDTFGDEDFWGGKLKLHKSILGKKLGGIGDGLSPKQALKLGLKVDSEALSSDLIKKFKKGQLNLDDPQVTVELLKTNAVVGLKGFFDEKGKLTSIGITCAFCHSTVDDSIAPGIGKRLDGWANRDINVGAIIASAPDLKPFTDLLGMNEKAVREVLLSWGPGKYDAILILDGKGFRPDGKTAAVLIPPAYGLAGVNLATWTGWGSQTYWNAFVANLQMHGKGRFFDPRINNPEKYPVATRAHLSNIFNEHDLITPKLAALHEYQLSLPAPTPPEGSYKKDAAARGRVIFNGKGKCASCHVPPLFSEPGFNLHVPSRIGVDSFQADRSPTKRYRTSPLKGLWAHQKGGFFHDGRFNTLMDVVNHYNNINNLNLSEKEKNDLVEYLKSL